MKPIISILILICLFPIFSYSQEVGVTPEGVGILATAEATPIPEQSETAVCMGESCLTGIPASIVQWFSILVVLATLAMKYVNKNTFIGTVLDKIANIKLKK